MHKKPGFHFTEEIEDQAAQSPDIYFKSKLPF